MGDAIVATVGGGIYTSVQDAVAHMVRMGTQYQPQATVVPLYDALSTRLCRSISGSPRAFQRSGGSTL